jgi:RNA polymerase sigma-70 factor (ECF subfamily)
VEDRAADETVIAVSLTDPAQFGLIFDRHYDAIHRYLARRVGWDLAEELTASVFLAAFGSRVRFRPSGQDARPWLLGIATNILRRHVRTEVRRLRAYGRVPRTDVVPFDGDALAKRLDAQRAAPLIGAALARLPEAERSALLLVAWADLTYEEVAIALDIPVGTVRSRLHRARNRFRELLAANGQYEDMQPVRALEAGNDG